MNSKSIISNIDKIITIENNSSSDKQNYEKEYKVKIMKLFLDHLKEKGVIDLQDFVKLLRDNGIKVKAQRNLIISLSKFMESEHKIRLVQRVVEKANYGERNIILCRFALEDPFYFVNAIILFIKEQYKEMKNLEKFQQDLDLKVHELNQISLNQIFTEEELFNILSTF